MDLAYRTPEDEVAALRHELAQTRAELGTAAVEIEHLRAQLAAMRRQQYGRSSERLDAEIAQLELRLEDLEESEAERQAAIVDPPTPTGPPKPRAKAVRKPLPDHLARETIVHEPEMVCGCCDPSKLARLGEDVTEVLEKIPARLKVIRHVRPRYACRMCEQVSQAPAPDLPIERGRPGPGLIAYVAVSKYCDGLPLFRQSVILAREGVEIDRATLADWIGRAAWWLAPLARLVGTTVMAQPVLYTDDTPIRTLAPGTGKTRLSRFWVYAVDARPHAGPGPPAAFYRYSPDRKGERPREHLAGFSGVIHADAFTGYDALCQCRLNAGSPALCVLSMRQAAWRTRARRSWKPARPYMVRFSILSRLIWPSTGLVVHGRSSAACMAPISRRRPAANSFRAVAIAASSIRVRLSAAWRRSRAFSRLATVMASATDGTWSRR